MNRADALSGKSWRVMPRRMFLRMFPLTLISTVTWALAVEEGPRYLLHIRNSAPYFNPLDMKMERVRKDMESEIMDSIGVMMIREKASSISFRNYQGYNVVTVEY